MTSTACRKKQLLNTRVSLQASLPTLQQPSLPNMEPSNNTKLIAPSRGANSTRVFAGSSSKAEKLSCGKVIKDCSQINGERVHEVHLIHAYHVHVHVPADLCQVGCTSFTVRAQAMLRGSRSSQARSVERPHRCAGPTSVVEACCQIARLSGQPLSKAARSPCCSGHRAGISAGIGASAQWPMKRRRQRQKAWHRLPTPRLEPVKPPPQRGWAS